MSGTNKKRTRNNINDNKLVQVDDYLSVIKRFNIPTSPIDTLDAVGDLQYTILFNTTLNKLRYYTGSEWRDAQDVDLSPYYTAEEITGLLTPINNNITNLLGLHLVANSATNEIYLRDGNNVTISTLNVAFLNNEGTTFIYNAEENTLELWNDQDELISSIPVSSFVTNSASNLFFNGTIPYHLELRDNVGDVMSYVSIGLTNVNGLVNALAGKEPTITILPISKGGTGKNTINENSFYVGGVGNILTEKTIQEVFDLLIADSWSVRKSDTTLNLVTVDDERLIIVEDGLDLAELDIVAGTYTKVTVDIYGRVTGVTNATVADYSVILNSLHQLSNNGFLVKNNDTVIARNIIGTTGRINVTNGSGISDNPTIDLVPTAITPGNYKRVEVDQYGRVISGTDNELSLRIAPGNVERLELFDSIFGVLSYVDLAIENISGLTTALGGKQATLVSGTNIKTINGESLLGSGNINTNLQIQIEIGANTLIQTTWNNATIIFTTNCTITVPSSLPDNFMFFGITLKSVTVNWAIQSPKTWLFGTPIEVPGKSTFTLMQRGSTNSIMLAEGY